VHVDKGDGFQIQIDAQRDFIQVAKNYKGCIVKSDCGNGMGVCMSYKSIPTS
jgi:hypothetical protein